MSFKPAHKPYYKSMNAFLHYTQVYQHVNSQYGFCLISESSVGRVPTYAVTVDFLRVTSNCSVLLWLNIHRSLDKVRHYRNIHYNWHSVNQLLLMCKKILWVSREFERISQCEPFYPLSIKKKMLWQIIVGLRHALNFYIPVQYVSYM